MSAIFSAKPIENALSRFAKFVESNRRRLYFYCAVWAIVSPFAGAIMNWLGVPGDVVTVVMLGVLVALVFVTTWVNEGNVAWLLDELSMAFSLPESPNQPKAFLESGGVVNVMGVKVFYMKRNENFRSFCERTKNIKGDDWALVPIDVPFVSFRYEGIDYAFRKGEEPFNNKFRGEAINSYEEYLEYVRYFVENLQIFISEKMLSENPSPATLRKIITTVAVWIFILPAFLFSNPLQEISQVMRNRAVEVPPANSKVEFVFTKDYSTYLEFRVADGIKDFRRLFLSERHRLPIGATLVYVSVNGKEVAKNAAVERVAHVSSEPQLRPISSEPIENVQTVNRDIDKIYETGVEVTNDVLYIVSVWVDRLIFSLVILLLLVRFVARVTANEVITVIDGYLFKNSLMLKINNVSVSITALLVIGTVILLLLRSLFFMINSGWNKVAIGLAFFALCFIAERLSNKFIPNPRAQRDDADHVLPTRSSYPNRRD